MDLAFRAQNQDVVRFHHDLRERLRSEHDPV